MCVTLASLLTDELQDPASSLQDFPCFPIFIKLFLEWGGIKELLPDAEGSRALGVRRLGVRRCGIQSWPRPS